MPCFHGNSRISATAGASDFLLYHGKLSVKENEKAAVYLIKNVFCRLPYRCIVAGMNPSATLLKAAAAYSNITVEANPSMERINALLRDAHVHVLVTFQGTGLKLKLLNCLFAGRHIVVNPLMLTGSGLDSLCVTADTPDRMVRICHELMQKPFSTDCLYEREKRLFPTFSGAYQAQRLADMIYNYK